MPSNKPQGVSQEQLPLGVELTQNYPNPFNNSTIIAFRIPATMNVKIKIYSEEWEEREKLVDKGFEAGGYNVIFHAIDLPSGEYYYTMEAGGSILIRKMKCVK